MTKRIDFYHNKMNSFQSSYYSQLDDDSDDSDDFMTMAMEYVAFWHETMYIFL